MAAMQRADGPTALILTRQKVATLNGIPVETRREGVLKGAYIARKEQGALKAIILASGSELELALKAAEKIGEGIRSSPCQASAALTRSLPNTGKACFPPPA